MFKNKKTTAKRGSYPALPFHPKGLSVLSGRSPGSCSQRLLPSRHRFTSGFRRRSHLQWRDRAGLSPASLL